MLQCTIRRQRSYVIRYNFAWNCRLRGGFLPIILESNINGLYHFGRILCFAHHSNRIPYSPRRWTRHRDRKSIWLKPSISKKNWTQLLRALACVGGAEARTYTNTIPGAWWCLVRDRDRVRDAPSEQNVNARGAPLVSASSLLTVFCRRTYVVRRLCVFGCCAPLRRQPWLLTVYGRYSCFSSSRISHSRRHKTADIFTTTAIARERAHNRQRVSECNTIHAVVMCVRLLTFYAGSANKRASIHAERREHMTLLCCATTTTTSERLHA